MSLYRNKTSERKGDRKCDITAENKGRYTIITLSPVCMTYLLYNLHCLLSY